MNDKIRVQSSNFTNNRNLSCNYFSNISIDKFKNALNDNSISLSVEQIEMMVSSLSDKLYYNDDKDFKISLNGFGTKIEFNPNKITGNSLINGSLNYDDFRTSFEIVEQKLSEIGISIDLKNQLIFSFHTAFDVMPNSNYANYEPVIKFSTLEQSTIRKSDKQYIESSIYLGNKSNKIVIYDKSKESSELMPKDVNMIRFEHRFEKLPKIKRLSLNRINENIYLNHRLKAKQLIYNNIFTYDSENKLDNDLTLLPDLFNHNVKNNDILKYVFAYFFQQKYGSKGLSIRDVLKVESSNRALYQQRTKLENIINIYKILPTDFINYYEELKTLFLKVG